MLILVLVLVLALFLTFTLELQEKRNTDSASSTASNTNNTSMASAWNAVEAFLVWLWKFIIFENFLIQNIFCWWCIDHILCHKTFDSLITWDHFSAVKAVDCLFTACIHFGTSAITSLLRHWIKRPWITVSLK